MEIWESYGKGTEARRQALMEKGLKQCTKCDGVKDKKEFGKHRSVCNLCRAAQSAEENDRTRPQADRIGLRWIKEEDKFIQDNYKTMTDGEMATKLKRTLKSVRRHRLFTLELNKYEQPAPKVLLDTFAWVKGDEIKAITLVVEGSKVTVFSNTNALWVNIWKAFKDEGWDDDDYQAWKVGVTN